MNPYTVPPMMDLAGVLRAVFYRISVQTNGKLALSIGSTYLSGEYWENLGISEIIAKIDEHSPRQQ